MRILIFLAYYFSEVFTCPWFQELAGFYFRFRIRSLPNEMTSTVSSPRRSRREVHLPWETSLARFLGRRGTHDAKGHTRFALQ